MRRERSRPLSHGGRRPGSARETMSESRRPRIARIRRKFACFRPGGPSGSRARRNLVRLPLHRQPRWRQLRRRRERLLQMQRRTPRRILERTPHPPPPHRPAHAPQRRARPRPIHVLMDSRKILKRLPCSERDVPKTRIEIYWQWRVVIRHEGHEEDRRQHRRRSAGAGAHLARSFFARGDGRPGVAPGRTGRGATMRRSMRWRRWTGSTSSRAIDREPPTR